MISLKDAMAFAESVMKENRFLHGKRVMQMGARIARAHMLDDDICNKIEIAAVLHDIARDKSEESLLSRAFEWDLNVKEYEMARPILLHGKVGAEMVKSKLGISDEDILNAIRYHTSGRIGMSVIEKIVMISDVIEMGRAFEGVEELREEAMRGIEDTFKKVVKNKIVYFVKHGLFVLPETYELWNHILMKEGKANGKELRIL